MSSPAPGAVVEGYVFHTYGAERYVQHAVASVVTLRRYDPDRPVALYAPQSHHDYLAAHGLAGFFQVKEELPEPNRSIVGFKHHLHRFLPFDRNLFVDSDMVWCRDPSPLWRQLSAFGFTATGQEKADFFFGGPKGFGVLKDVFRDRRRETMRRFGLTHLPRVQAGMIYTQDAELARSVCERSQQFLAARAETHFRSRLDEGRSEETCEWSLAMSMSAHELPIFPWHQGYNSPQLDFIEGFTRYDPDFEEVACRYYSDPLVYSIRGLQHEALRDRLLAWASALPGRGDYMDVTPFVLHFSWLHHKRPFLDSSRRVWERLAAQTQEQPAAAASALSLAS